MLFNPWTWDKIWDGPNHSELWESFANHTDCPVGFQKICWERKTFSFITFPCAIPHIQRQEETVFPLWNLTKPCWGCGQSLNAAEYSPVLVKSVWGLGLPYRFDVETEGNRLREMKKKKKRKQVCFQGYSSEQKTEPCIGQSVPPNSWLSAALAGPKQSVCEGWEGRGGSWGLTSVQYY